MESQPIAPEQVLNGEDTQDPLARYAKPHDSDEWGPCAIQKCRENDGTMVTVVCITYNHEAFIADALESIVSQVTDFKFKVFVGDDCSTDRTPEIVKRYAELYPNLIVPFCREENLGGLGKRNLIDLCQRATSPYIAFCEGDDYWIDDNKLQKQFDFMEENRQYRACFMHTYVDAPDDWHLRSWYKATPDGDIILPSGHPLFVNQNDYSPSYIVSRHDAHTSTHFYRWNYDLEIPEWYYKGMIGDTPLVLLQLGNSNLKILPDIASCYRINEGSVFFTKNRDSHFLDTRLDYLDYLGGIRRYALDHFKNYSVTAIENRIKLESYNYLSTAIKYGNSDLILTYFEKYPEEGMISLNAYLIFYQDSRMLTNSLGWNDYMFMVRNGKQRKWLPKLAKQLHRKNSIEAIPKKAKSEYARKKRVLDYWLTSKNDIIKGLWVFSGFKSITFEDNTRYLFDYVVNNRPEITAVWITSSLTMYRNIASMGYPVEMRDTELGQEIMRRAEVAVIDHYVMSDFGRPRPLNKDVKVLQLWHGVGLKSMHNLGLANFKGTEYISDLDDDPDDSIMDRLKKRRKWISAVAKTEQCENYYMMVVPGREMQDAYEDGFRLPPERFFHSGYPRMDALINRTAGHQGLPQPTKILYAPTFRYSKTKEEWLVDTLIDNFKQIEQRLERIDASFVIRLHPHTWRSYGAKLRYATSECERITIDETKDIYAVLDEYSVLITDYSSIAYDFLLLDRPMVFLCPDLEWYLKNEPDLRYDFKSHAPGAAVDSWAEAFDAVKRYLENPSLDNDFRKRIRQFFYDDISTDGHASEHIVDEMLRRIAADESSSAT